MDTFKEIIVWLVLGAASAPVWGALLYALWQRFLRPRLVPSGEIERLAADLLKRHGDHAAKVAFADEFHAWRHSNGIERDKWRRVRWHIERRCAQRTPAHPRESGGPGNY